MNFDFHISPKVGQWLALASFVLGLFMAGTWWQDLLTTKQVAVAMGLTNILTAAINFVLHGAPSPQGYFDKKPDEPK